jgi:hypothetical protein
VKSFHAQPLSGRSGVACRHGCLLLAAGFGQKQPVRHPPKLSLKGLLSSETCGSTEVTRPEPTLHVTSTCAALMRVMRLTG